MISKESAEVLLAIASQVTLNTSADSFLKDAYKIDKAKKELQKILGIKKEKKQLRE